MRWARGIERKEEKKKEKKESRIIEEEERGRGTGELYIIFK